LYVREPRSEPKAVVLRMFPADPLDEVVLVVMKIVLSTLDARDLDGAVLVAAVIGVFIIAKMGMDSGRIRTIFFDNFYKCYISCIIY